MKEVLGKEGLLCDTSKESLMGAKRRRAEVVVPEVY